MNEVHQVRGGILVWEEEFGGGAWVFYPRLDPDATVRSVRQSVLYGAGYQGQGAPRRWKSFRGNSQGY